MTTVRRRTEKEREKGEVGKMMMEDDKRENGEKIHARLEIRKGGDMKGREGNSCRGERP